MTDLFEARARNWDASDRRTRLAFAIDSSILQHVQLHEPMYVLDSGAGTELISRQIAPRVKRIATVDISQALLHKLEAKPELQGKVETVCRDILEHPLDARFDLIASPMEAYGSDNRVAQ